MAYEQIILQVMFFVRTLVWGGVILGTIGVMAWLYTYKYIIELNVPSGSGIILKQYRARLFVDKDGNQKFKSLRGKIREAPADKTSIYKQGFSFRVRYYDLAENDYRPIKFDLNNQKFTPVPYNIKRLHLSARESIDARYAQKKKFIEQYGAIMALGVAGIVFVIAVYFIMQQVGEAISLGKSVIGAAAQCVQEIPPA